MWQQHGRAWVFAGNHPALPLPEVWPASSHSQKLEGTNPARRYTVWQQESKTMIAFNIMQMPLDVVARLLMTVALIAILISMRGGGGTTPRNP